MTRGLREFISGADAERANDIFCDLRQCSIQCGDAKNEWWAALGVVLLLTAATSYVYQFTTLLSQLAAFLKGRSLQCLQYDCVRKDPCVRNALPALASCVETVRVWVLKCPRDLLLAFAGAWGPLMFFIALLQAFGSLESPGLTLILGLVAGFWQLLCAIEAIITPVCGLRGSLFVLFLLGWDILL